MRVLVSLLLFAAAFFRTYASESELNTYPTSREGDPASLIENVSTIHGDYSEVEVDVIVRGPDSLCISRSYSSRGLLESTTLGGWQLLPQCYLTVERHLRRAQELTGGGKGIFTHLRPRLLP